jgi:hypothetical protein
MKADPKGSQEYFQSANWAVRLSLKMMK